VTALKNDTKILNLMILLDIAWRLRLFRLFARSQIQHLR